MAYNNTSSEIRPDLNAVVEEAMYADEGYIAQGLMPFVGYPTKTGEYKRLRLRTGKLLRSYDGNATLRTPKAAYPEIDGTDEADNYRCHDRGLTEKVDDADRADTKRFYALEEVALKRVTRAMKLDHEIRVKNQIMNTNNFSEISAPTVNYTAALSSTIDFMKDVTAAARLVQKLGERPNTVAMNIDLWDRIAQSTLLATRIFGSNSGGKTLTPSVVETYISEILRMPIRLLVASASYEGTKKGKGTATVDDMNWVWPDSHFFVGCVMDGILEQGGVGRTIFWEEDSPSPFVTESNYDWDIRSEKVRVRHQTDEKIVNENCGILQATNFA